MLNWEDKVKKNPIMFFIIILFGITIFLFTSFIIALVISYNPTISVVSSFFNQTNVSTTLDFFISTTANGSKGQVNSSVNSSFFNNTFSIDSISSMIALLGSFGIFAYLFYSIKEGTISKTENKKLLYGFLSSMGIIIFLVVIVFSSFFQGRFPNEKYLEIFVLLFFLIFTMIVAYFFDIIFNAIEENYDNRVAIIDFLEIQNSKEVIWQPIDNFVRFIVYANNFSSYFIFILICLIPIVGILIGLNLLSIIFIEIMIFTLFSGYCRLISLCKSDSNITLNNRLSLKQYSFSSKYLSKVFFLPSQDDDYFKILTKKGYITILKNEVITIHDNELVIFKGKTKLSPLNIWVKRFVRFVLSSILAYFFFLIIFYATVWIVFLVQPRDLLQVLQTTMPLLLLTIGENSVIFAFCTIGWFCETIDKYLEEFVDSSIIVPRSLEFF